MSNDDFLKVKTAFEKNPQDIIREEYYDYLKAETGLKRGQCHKLLIEYLLKKKC